MRRQLSFAKPIEAYRGRRRTGRWSLLIFLGALVISGIAIAAFVSRSANQVLDPSAQPRAITIAPGSGTPQIAEQLFNEQLIVSQNAFKVAVVLEGARGKLQAGTYELSAALSARQIVEIMRDGQIKELRVTIPEGLRLDEIADRMEDKNIVKSDDFLRAARQEYQFSFLQSKPSDADLEGFLFPDTYHFAPGVTAEEVVTKMLTNFQEKIADLLPQFEEDKRSLYEILILASLIEGEVPHEEDRPIVAGVFTNRLAEDMKLQADSTLAYITKKDTIDFTTADIELDDPYNTYQYVGLPPGPINSPGLSAIKAALDPADTEFFYFVSDPDTDETLFAKTLEEHEANVDKALND